MALLLLLCCKPLSWRCPYDSSRPYHDGQTAIEGERAADYSPQERADDYCSRLVVALSDGVIRTHCYPCVFMATTWWRCTQHSSLVVAFLPSTALSPKYFPNDDGSLLARRFSHSLSGFHSAHGGQRWTNLAPATLPLTPSQPWFDSG